MSMGLVNLSLEEKKRKLEEIIARAIQKLGLKKENELCKYLPIETGGYVHHFTLKKMKSKEPEELASVIERHILKSQRPMVVAPKPRAPRGSKKRKDHLSFTRNQIERMLNIAKIAGDKEIVTILSPRRSLTSAKRELLQAIKRNQVDSFYWSNYVDAVQQQVGGSRDDRESLLAQSSIKI